MWEKLKNCMNINLFVHEGRGDDLIVTHNTLSLLITTLGEHLMSAISDFATKFNAFNVRQDAAMADLQADIDNLTAQIAALQASAGAITPEDQALLDGITARASAVSDKLDALDALTPPVPPKA